MSKCRKCANCVNCDLWQYYTFSAAKILMLRTFLKVILWKEQCTHELRELYKNALGWIAHYPERQKFRIYLGKGVIYIWLSFAADEPKSYPV